MLGVFTDFYLAFCYSYANDEVTSSSVTPDKRVSGLIEVEGCHPAPFDFATLDTQSYTGEPLTSGDAHMHYSFDTIASSEHSSTSPNTSQETSFRILPDGTLVRTSITKTVHRHHLSSQQSHFSVTPTLSADGKSFAFV